MMQTLKLRPIFNVKATNKNIVRCVNRPSVKAAEETVVELKSWKEIPGPSPLPVIGQLHNFLPGGPLYKKTGMDLYKELYEKYGPITRFDPLLGRPALLMFFDAESIEQLLRGENSMPVRPGFQSLEYYRKEYKKSKEESSRPTGLITDHGDNWKQFRSKVNPILLQPKTVKLYSTALSEVADDMITRMRSIRDEKDKLRGNFDIEMNLWALESIGVVALGDRLNCFDPNLPKDSPARQLIKCVHDVFEVSNKLDFNASIWRYVSTPTFKKAMKLYEDQSNITKYFVKKAVNELQSNTRKHDDEKPVLEKLLEIDEEMAHIMASDMLFAGVDTAANTMIATLYLLATNQEKQNKLREEVTSTSNEDRRPYLAACIKESMRVMPVVSGNIRQTTKEYHLLGYKIPKGMYVTFGHMFLSLMEEHYPRAQEFIPERWICDKNDPLYYGNTNPFVNNPFGFGVRSCIGRRIAELELKIFLAKLVQNFQIEWFGPPPLVAEVSLNYVKGPFNFIFKDIVPKRMQK